MTDEPTIPPINSAEFLGIPPGELRLEKPIQHTDGVTWTISGTYAPMSPELRKEWDQLADEEGE